MTPAAASPHCLQVAPDLILDSRRALLSPSGGWLAVADVHFGYEVRRRRAGGLVPAWGMAECASVMQELIQDHQPRRLILVGDIMDGSASAEEALSWLQHLREQVELVCIEGNHDRPPLRRRFPMVKSHQEGAFRFEHGHLPLSDSSEGALVTGHVHPAYRFTDGAGLKLKLPVLIQERLPSGVERWILPAFSPWSAGGLYESPHERLGCWACAPRRVWRVD